MAVSRFVIQKPSASLTARTVNLQGLQFDPGLLQLPGGFTTGGQTQTPQPPSPPPAQPSTPTGPSANLQALLASIPIALDGQVITSDHHNSLRSALIAMANEMGVGLIAPATAYTFAPALIQFSDLTGWGLDATNAIALSGTGGSADGFLPVQLPDGLMIQNMTVKGGLTPPAPKVFQVTLFRESMAAGAPPSPEALVTIDLSGQSGAFSQPGAISVGASRTASGTQAKQAAAFDMALIDNSTYTYFVRATLSGPGPATKAEIDAIQITVVSA